MRVVSDSRSCRVLAAVAWVITSVWYYFVLGLAWGAAQAAMLFWTPPALLVACLTWRWLRQSGRAPSGRTIGVWAMLWASVFVVLFAGNLLPPIPIGVPVPLLHHRYLVVTQTLSLAFPIALTVWALWRVGRQPPSPVTA